MSSFLVSPVVECSRRMKKCIKCQVTITKKLKQGMFWLLLLIRAVGRVLHGVSLRGISDFQ